MQVYRDFRLGEHYRTTPFWAAAHQVYEHLNPKGPPAGFIWSNLIKVDRHGNHPDPAVEEECCELFGVLTDEIALLQPDVVLFLTGPQYDQRLLTTFAGAKLTALRVVYLGARHVRLGPNQLDAQRERAPLDDFVGHMGYTAELVGVDHVAGSTDSTTSMDMSHMIEHADESNAAYPNPVSITHLPALTAKLLVRGLGPRARGSRPPSPGLSAPEPGALGPRWPPAEMLSQSWPHPIRKQHEITTQRPSGAL